MTEHKELRVQIDQALAEGAWSNARALLAQLWRREAGPAAAGFVLPRFEKLRPRFAPVACRLAILRSFTVEPLVPIVRAAAAIEDIDLTVHVGDFNAYAQEILNGSSSLYSFDPSIVVLAVQTRDVAPDLWNGFADLSPAQIQTAVERVAGDFRNWVLAFRERSRSNLIIHGLESPPWPAYGVWDAQSTSSQVMAITEINRLVRRMVREFNGVYFLDYDALVAQRGRLNWRDEGKWLTIRMPIAANYLIHVVNEWLRFIHPLLGKSCKVLVTDLDNTLWGGVVGEDGINGIQVGPDYPGAAYLAVQRTLLDLCQRGIVLAVCSKNNPADALEVLERHQAMLLRPQHFAARRINWNDKVQNLREIAAELNVGTEALALLDDNPIERQRVRLEMPEVTVVELPDDPMGYADAVREHPAFERLALSTEDRERAQYYAQRQQRVELERSTGSVEDFYRSLAQEVKVAPLTRENLARIAQLIQKTNQFNLTTHRYSEQQIQELAARPGCEVWSFRVGDRFGDNGLVGVAITRRENDRYEIDTFLLSCRVIGRTVETAMLSFLVDRARANGVKRVEGWFMPTPKNVPAKNFYSVHGFCIQKEEGGSTLWSLELSTAKITCPDWIKLSVVNGKGR